MIGNRARTRLSDANHLALNICELAKLIEFRGMWSEVVTWGHFQCSFATFATVFNEFTIWWSKFRSFHFRSFFLIQLHSEEVTIFHIVF